MSEKSQPASKSGDGAQQIFRQFAWNLAGTISAQRRSATASPQKPATRAARGTRAKAAK